MSGIAQILSIAKEALLAQQLAMQVGSNNVANVNTDGYSRQSLELAPNQATPTAAGSLGGGVHGDSITRAYDQFMVARINRQESQLGNLQAQQQTLKVIGATFNEAQGLGLNDLLSKFWSSWQDLANNPEDLATRQAVVQAGQLLVDQFHTMNSEIISTRQDISNNLDTAVSDVNSLTSQIAALNVQIGAAEGPKTPANDLRDRRDQLVKQLSGLLNINYFEDKNGSYTIMMADGHTLVEGDESWQVDWNNNQLYWVNRDINGNETKQAVGSGAELGGKIGGWLETGNQLADNNPDNFTGRLDALANSLIRVLNQQHTQGVGLENFTAALTGAETAKNTAVLTGTVNAATATSTIPAGTITINDRTVGTIAGGTAVNGLAMTKAANAVDAINNAITGATAKLTTLVAGSAVNPAGLANGNQLSFTINGVTVNYTFSTPGPPDDTNPATFATDLTTAINTAITAYNAAPTTTNPVTIQAAVGDGTNGGVLNSLVLKNTNPGDASDIVIANLTSTPAGVEGAAGLTAGTYSADATHNTGQVTLFTTATINVSAGHDDTYLAQLGLDSTHIPGDTIANDGKFSYTPSASDPVLLQGYAYANELATDGGSFNIWLYNSDGSLARSQPVTVSTDRLYTLQDTVNAINTAVTNAGGSGWLTASIDQNHIKLTPDSSHAFAFANDTSNFLQVAGLNTFFSGNNAASIAINGTVANDLSNLAAATVGTNGEIFKGDNTNALTTANIANRDDIKFTGAATANSLSGFYGSLIGDIGSQSSTLDRDMEFSTLVSNQLNQMRDSVSGVSLDEEMANLIKYQHAYTAASKLITTSDEMLQTLLNAV